MLRQLIGLVLILAAACRKDTPTQPTPESAAGTWLLTSVNGAPLPFAISQTSTQKDEILSNVATLTAAANYTSTFQIRTTISGQATISTMSESGAFSIQGSTITFLSSAGALRTGSITDKNISLTDDGFLLSFTKQ